LDGGVLAQSLFAYGTVDEDRVEIYGTDGKLTVDRFHSIDVEHRPARLGASRLARLGVGYRGASPRAVLRSPVLAQRLRAPLAEPSYGASLAHFVDAVAAGRQPSPDLADGVRALAVIDAAIHAAAERRRVDVSRIDVG
jgi:predicted dehydrogenase